MFSWFRGDSGNSNGNGMGLGNVSISDNSNSKLSGSGNSGVITDNFNIKLSATSCNLKVKDNANTDFKISGANIECVDCSNSEISGSAKSVWLHGNSNSEISLNSKDHAELEAKGNSNLEVNLKDAVLKLFGNVNAQVGASRGTKLEAFGNTNLKFEGDNGGHAHIRDTVNHDVYQSKLMEGSTSLNKLEFSVSGRYPPRGIDITNPLQIREILDNVKYSLGFVDKCEINRNHYTVGIFNFSINKAQQSPSLEVKLDKSNFDSGSVSTQFKPPSEVKISAAKNGIKQNFNIKAPQVKHGESSEVFVVEMLS